MGWIGRRPASVFCALLLGVASGAWAGDAAPDPRVPRALLRAGQLAELEAWAAALHVAAEGNVPARSFAAFRSLTSDETALLRAWVASAPNSTVAKLALAERELAIGWERLGRGPVAHLDARERGLVAKQARTAARLAEASRLEDPRWLDVHRIQLDAARLLGDPELAERAWARGFAAEPANHDLWSALLDGLSRRWGGSYRQLEQAAASAQANAGENPRLRFLLARAAADRARDLHDANEFRDALEQWELALVHGEQAWLLRERAWTQHHAGRATAALAGLDRAIELEPYDADAHHRRAHVLMALERFAEAAEAAGFAADLAPSRDHFAWVQQSAAAKHRDAAEWARLVENRNVAAAALHSVGWWASNLTAGLLAVGLIWAVRRLTRMRRIVPDAPRAALSLVLRAYAWFMLGRHIVVYATIWDHASVLDQFVGAPAGAVSALGAVAFAQGWRLGSSDIWRLCACFYPVWVLAHWFGIEGARLSEPAVWSLTLITLLPLFAMVFAYGYRSQEIWARDRVLRHPLHA